MDVSDSLTEIRAAAERPPSEPDLELRMHDLEAALRAGAIHRKVLEGHLQFPLGEDESIEIRWMLLGLDIIEKHRQRLIEHLVARRSS